MKKMKCFTSIKLILACSILTIFQLQNSYGQMVITEIKAVYKSKMDNRIISEEEFQSFKGRHLFHKLIKGKRGAIDTRALLGKFLSHTAFEYAVIPNASNIAKEYGIHAFPTHIIIDKNGIVRYSTIGFKEGSIKQLKSKINQILM